MKIAVLSNINMEPLRTFLNADEKVICDYGQYMQELLDENSSLYSGNPDIIFLHLDGEEFAKDVLYGLVQTKDAENILGQRLDIVFEAAKKYLMVREHATLLFSTLVFPPFYFINYLDTNSDYSFSSTEHFLNEKILKFAASIANVFVLDWKRPVLFYGYKAMYDEKFWFLGRIKYTNKALKVLSEEISNCADAVKGNIKKVLVLDLDNTLWGGIIGEDGINGIKLSEDGIGKAYRDFQFVVKAMKDLGVILAINSKNNPEDAINVFANHPMMVLKEEDFVILKINWNNKVDNMKEIAQELNLGLDSFVFIDDNGREREMVRQNSVVAVPEFPDDPAQLKEWFLKDIVYKYFPKVFITKEDAGKAGQYKANIKRGDLSKHLNIDEFIKSLEIRIEVYVNDGRFVQRTAQLTQKTNQFNVTTRRYTEADIEQFMKKGNVYALSYTDRFGDEGIVGCAVVSINGDAAYLDALLMSCRVIGRNVEFLFLRRILSMLSDKGVKVVKSGFIPTNKNIVARDFFDKSGFIALGEDNGVFTYECNVVDALRHLTAKYIA
ncbi:MAG: HAD family hydrolase [Nitrospirae bacterium]|nr:HAD family hydrolase [Nitrospirota bacterium]